MACRASKTGSSPDSHPTPARGSARARPDRRSQAGCARRPQSKAKPARLFARQRARLPETLRTSMTQRRMKPLLATGPMPLSAHRRYPTHGMPWPASRRQVPPKALPPGSSRSPELSRRHEGQALHRPRALPLATMSQATAAGLAASEAAELTNWQAAVTAATRTNPVAATVSPKTIPEAARVRLPAPVGRRPKRPCQGYRTQPRRGSTGSTGSCGAWGRSSDPKITVA